jgi:glucose/arabinose dehydrogenase
VTEKAGVVRVLEDEVLLEEPFLDIRNRVTGSQFDEQGLLSIAFPPDYGRSRRFYLYLINNDGDIEVDEFSAGAGIRRVPSRPPAAVIVVPHPIEANHNGGTVQVDDRGRLWLATGDGGGGGDTHDNARDLESLLGKLLLVRPVPKNPETPGYRIPQGNPYVGVEGRDEIYSYGLRNPYRFTVDSERKAVSIGDVGQGNLEGVDVLAVAAAKGANFGWPEYEGAAIYDASRPGPDPATAPTWDYPNLPTPARR